jgi:RNA polymerase sigma factor (sigma-70 family)
MSETPTETQTSLRATTSYVELVQSILSLDPDTWTQLHEDYSERLQEDIRKSLHKWGLLPDLVEDIEQETWLTAIHCMSEFVWIDELRFYHWLRAISLKHIWTERRKQKRYMSFNDLEDDDSNEFMDTYLWDSECVEDVVIMNDRMRILERVLRELKPSWREIVMRRMMGETPRELAAAYGLEPVHLRQILWRTKQKIQALLPPEDDTDD